MSPADDNPNDVPIVDDAAPTGQKPLPLPRETTTSLKRGREASVDLLASETTSAAHIAAKKNRLEEDAPEQHSETDDDTGSQTAADASSAKEGHTVGEVRRKVQEMNWKEGEQKPEATEGAAVKPDKGASSPAAGPSAAGDEAAKNPADLSTVSDDAEEPDWVKVDRAAVSGSTINPEEAGKSDKPGSSVSEDAEQESDTPSLKRKAKEDAAEDATAVEEKKRKSTSPSPTGASSTQPETGASSSAAAQKPAATFGAFSTKASPFASLGGSSKSVFGSSSASPFAAAAGKPSAFANAASQSLSQSSAAVPKPSGSSTFATSGFGSYSTTSSPFAAKTKAEDSVKEGASSANFGDILQEKGEEEEETREKLHLDRQAVPTGEEDEETMFQTRAKLFTMENEGAWKERGVGLLKVNRRRVDASGARLVMRADGVLRVILNANLYVGMPCKEDGKHVRTTIFEGPERRFITIRTANPKAASELAATIHEHIPLESKAPSKSPQPKADSAV